MTAGVSSSVLTGRDAFPNRGIRMGGKYHKLYVEQVRALLAVFSMHTRVRASCYGYDGLRVLWSLQIMWITLITFLPWTKVYTTRPNPIISRDVRREGHSQGVLTNLVVVYDRMGKSDEVIAM